MEIYTDMQKIPPTFECVLEKCFKIIFDNFNSNMFIQFYMYHSQFLDCHDYYAPSDSMNLTL